MDIRKIAIAGLVAAGAAAPHAAAAAGPYNWTGSYFGAFAGYGWSSTGVGTTHLYQDSEGTDEYSGSPLDPFSYSGNGGIGGVEAGYNWQSGNLVFGVVADIGAANIKGSFTNEDANFTSDSTLKWLGTARANIGVPLAHNILLYGTGGLAYGGITANLTDYYPDDVTLHSSDSFGALGWVIGAGAAVAVSPNWMLRAEYLYADLGRHNVTFHEDEVDNYGFPLITSSAQTTASILKFGIDYKF